MINYIKSECYRVSRAREIYGMAGILLSLIVLAHIMVHYFGGRYCTTSYSYSNLVSNPMIYAVMGMLLAELLYEGSRRNGTMKHTIAGGMTRDKIFLGECIVSILTATVFMAVLLAAWVMSAGMLLEQTGPVTLSVFLREVLAVYLIAAAGLISAILFLEVFDKNIVGIVVWVVIWFLIPKLFLYLAMRFEAVQGIAFWMPDNLFGVNKMHVNTMECITIWDTDAGLFKCVLSGAVGTVLFLILGAAALRKKDL